MAHHEAEQEHADVALRTIQPRDDNLKLVTSTWGSTSSMSEHGDTTHITSVQADGRTTYEYEPLKIEGEYIRLILLQPALQYDAQLHVTFLHSQELNDDALRYEAISYTWGEPVFNSALLIGDDRQLMITSNLSDALKRVRRPTKSRALWVDALCINQGNDEEKSKQIPMMASIFHNASRVLAYVGEGETEEKGLRLLDAWSRGLGSSFDLRLRRQGASAVGTLEDQKVLRPVSMLIINIFLSLPWFSRLWIIQEVVFNVDVLLICGDSQISWARLVAAIEALHESPRAYNSQVTAANPGVINRAELASLRTIANLWKRHCMIDITSQGEYDAVVGKLGIVHLVENFRHYGCTDPRDRIYALYNMAADILPTKLSIQEGTSTTKISGELRYVYMDADYGVDVLDVYRTFAASCLCSSSKIDLLNALLAREHMPLREEWPSWVPDWRLEPSPGRRRSLGKESSIVGDSSLYLPDDNVMAIEVLVAGGKASNAPLWYVVQCSHFVTNNVEDFLQFILDVCKVPCNAMFLHQLLYRFINRTGAQDVAYDAFDINEAVEKHLEACRLGIETNAKATDILRRLTIVYEALQGYSFFIAHASHHHDSCIIGYGNPRMKIGDEVVWVSIDPNVDKSWVCVSRNLRMFAPQGHDMFLVFRPAKRELNPPIHHLHQFIGSADLLVAFVEDVGVTGDYLRSDRMSHTFYLV